MYNQKLTAVLLMAMLSSGSYANQVMLTTNKPMDVSYRIAHQKKDHKPVFEAVQTMHLARREVISLELKDDELVGVEIMSLAGHELPPTVNQFNKKEQCSMTTDATHPIGTLRVRLDEKTARCITIGGVFGQQ